MNEESNVGYNGPMMAGASVGQRNPGSGILAGPRKTAAALNEVISGGETLQAIENMRRLRGDIFDIIISLNHNLRPVLSGPAVDEVNLPERGEGATMLACELNELEESLQAIICRLLDIKNRINI